MERILRCDPAGLHGLSDFETRDVCRHAIERLAKRSHSDEAIVAERAISLARKAFSTTQPPDRRAYVGYYLIDQGLHSLSREFGCRGSSSCPAVMRTSSLRLVAFLSTVLLITVALTAAFAYSLQPLFFVPIWAFVTCCALFAVGASQVGVVIANTMISMLLTPQRLPRLDFEKGIPML
jgi:hypothetical protein